MFYIQCNILVIYIIDYTAMYMLNKIFVLTIIPLPARGTCNIGTL